MIADASERQKALDPQRSFIVQAPAGSGKTELLIQRYMVLLARVKQPGEVLAITFTRKAAAEMRQRVMDALAIALGPCPDEVHKQTTWRIAKEVLAADRRNDWQLQLNPAQLRIQTMDSFNSQLVQRMPWLSRLGGMPSIAANPAFLYRQAAEECLQDGQASAEIEHNIKILLAHLDNRLDRLVEMIAQLLSRREQWIEYLLSTDHAGRQPLEQAIQHLTDHSLCQIDEALSDAQRNNLVYFIRVADDNLSAAGEAGFPAWRDRQDFPKAEAAETERWRELSELLLTGKGHFRKTVTKKEGFPPDEKETKQAFIELLTELSQVAGLANAFERVRKTAANNYTEEQWAVLEALLQLLPLATLRLWQVFTQKNEVDFPEIALKAKEALHGGATPTDLLQQLDQTISHILVDEFQDTSHLQCRMLLHLIEGWEPADGRTLFLVGDPMQSIYRFREAEVGLFLQAKKGTFGPVKLEPLELKCNFRTQASLVEWNNRCFSQSFPEQEDALYGAVPFAPAQAVWSDEDSPVALTLYEGAEADREAASVADIVASIQAKGEETIAILVRSRTHLSAIFREFKRRDIAFLAQDVEALEDRQSVLDIQALTKALCHPGDQLSWFSILRSPMCGLGLRELLTLKENLGTRTLMAWQEKDTASALSPDAQRRLNRVLPVLQHNCQQRGCTTLRRLVEGAWLQLGGLSAYTPVEIADARRALDVVERLEEGGDLPSFSAFDDELARLFSSANPLATGQVQVMTIHKAKGLEFDHVILPGLGRLPRNNENQLLRWFYDPAINLVLAPLPAKDGSGTSDPVYEALKSIDQERSVYECARLLYVACTRAIKRLYLLGNATKDKQGELKADSRSFLALLLPTAKELWTDDTPVLNQEPNEGGVLSNRFRQLPAAWQPPTFDSTPYTTETKAPPPSQQNPAEILPVFTGFEADKTRQIGIQVHRVLEQICHVGLEQWDESHKRQLEPALQAALSSVAPKQASIQQAVTQVWTHVERCLASKLGRWILSPHEQAQCEYDLTGVVAGRVVRGIIDRTFVDRGVRWIIDYKTSVPGDESSAVFLQRKVEQYRGQMDLYRQLFEGMQEEHPIQCLLYFPQADLSINL